MSKIFRQGLNWIIVDYIADVSSAKKMLEDVYDDDWSDYTSAKGKNSRQNYVINPKWMPKEDFVEPKDWSSIKERFETIVQREVVYHGMMPANWTKLHACSAWTVSGEEGSFHTIHEHGPMNICSVTYLQVPKNQIPPYGQIFFVLDASPYNPLSTPSSRILHLTPQEGMIVIFPSWILHGVYPQGQGTRQTLNIDFNGDPNYRFDIPHSGSTSYN